MHIEKIIERSEIKDEIYQEIFSKETHHKHPIIQDSSGTLRWIKDPKVDKLINELDLNKLMELFHRLGYDRNSEIVRELYRSMGYSLFGYWEVFYWDVNNELASKYKGK